MGVIDTMRDFLVDVADDAKHAFDEILDQYDCDCDWDCDDDDRRKGRKSSRRRVAADISTRRGESAIELSADRRGEGGSSTGGSANAESLADEINRLTRTVTALQRTLDRGDEERDDRRDRRETRT